MVGCGEPCARHFNVMLEPSRTITSLELKLSSIFGGTKKRQKEEGSPRIRNEIEIDENFIKHSD